MSEPPLPNTLHQPWNGDRVGSDPWPIEGKPSCRWWETTSYYLPTGAPALLNSVFDKAEDIVNTASICTDSNGF